MVTVLCHTDELAPGEIIARDIPGIGPIAVYNLDGAFYATEDTCTHGEASLADGEVVNGRVVCPLHMGSFDIRTGAAIAAPCFVPIKTFFVDVVDGEVRLRV